MWFFYFYLFFKLMSLFLYFFWSANFDFRSVVRHSASSDTHETSDLPLCRVQTMSRIRQKSDRPLLAKWGAQKARIAEKSSESVNSSKILVSLDFIWIIGVEGSIRDKAGTLVGNQKMKGRKGVFRPLQLRFSLMTKNE